MHQIQKTLQDVHAALDELQNQLDGAQTDEQFEDTIPQIDRRMQQAYYELEACRRYVTLHRAPVHKAYDPAALLRSQSGHVPMDLKNGREVPELEGDPQQILDTLKVILESMKLHKQMHLTAALYIEGDVPRYSIGVQGMAVFPTEYNVGKYFSIKLEQLDHTWRHATGGGSIDHTPSLVTLELGGEPASNGSLPDAKAISDELERAARRLMPWRTADGQYHGGLVHPDETRQLYAQSIKKVQELANSANERLAALQ